MPLLTLQDVRDLVPQEDFSDGQLTVTFKLVAGWLREASGRTDVDSGTQLVDTDLLFSPALELVALVAENPTSLASRAVGPTSRTWPQARRRDAILERVRRTYGQSAAAGEFPDAQCWPDPALGWGRR